MTVDFSAGEISLIRAMDYVEGRFQAEFGFEWVGTASSDLTDHVTNLFGISPDDFDGTVLTVAARGLAGERPGGRWSLTEAGRGVAAFFSPRSAAAA